MMRLKIFIGLLFLQLMSFAAVPHIAIGNSSKYQRLADYTQTTILNTISNLPEYLRSGTDTIRIRIVSTSAEFRAVTGTDLPYWVGAVTLFPQDLIVLRSPDLSKSTLREYRTTVGHELVHYMQGQLVPLNLTPVWFNEGLALYFSGEFGLSERVLVSKVLWRPRLIPLNGIERMMQFSHPRAELAYAESGSAVEFLDVVYGSETFLRIFDSMRGGLSFDRALSLAIENEEVDFESQWQKYLAQRYNWIFLLDIQNILWLIIPVLALVAYVSIRRRNKKKLRQWNVEEANESNDEENI